MKKRKTYYLVLTSILLGIILLLSLIPNLGFIIIGPISITIVHIPVLIGIMILPFYHSIALGLGFGVGSLFASFLYAKSPVDLAFHNPLISLVPKIVFVEIIYLLKYLFFKIEKKKKTNIIFYFLIVCFVGLITFLLPQLLKNQIKTKWFNFLQIFLALSGAAAIIYIYFLKEKKKDLKLSIPTIFLAGSIIHSIVTIFYLCAIPNKALEMSSFVKLIAIILPTNILVEALVATVIGSSIVYVLNKFKRGDKV